jgi:hypothetical protein
MRSSWCQRRLLLLSHPASFPHTLHLPLSLSLSLSLRDFDLFFFFFSVQKSVHPAPGECIKGKGGGLKIFTSFRRKPARKSDEGRNGLFVDDGEVERGQRG